MRKLSVQPEGTGVEGEGEEEGEVVGEGGEGVEDVVGDGDRGEVEDPVGHVPTVVHWPSLAHFKYSVNRGYRHQPSFNLKFNF